MQHLLSQTPQSLVGEIYYFNRVEENANVAEGGEKCNKKDTIKKENDNGQM